MMEQTKVLLLLLASLAVVLSQRRQRVRFDAIRDQAYSEILETHDLTEKVQNIRKSECMDLCKFNLDCYGLTFKVKSKRNETKQIFV